MNKFIEILKNNKDNYFFGGEKNLTPFISGEFTEKFKETIFAGDTHCKYNFNKNGYSEFQIELCKNPNRIKFIDIQINKKGNKYDKVRCMFKNSLDVQRVKKIFIGHTESKLIEKEEFYNMIKQAEIELFDYFDNDDKEEILNSDNIYSDYIKAVSEYNNENKNIISIDQKFGFETKFYFDLYGNIKEICICEDYGYDMKMSITIEHEKQQASEQVKGENKLASEQDINDLLNLFN